MKKVVENVPIQIATENKVELERLANIAEARAKQFIYDKESSNMPWAVNELGCYGLGQDCNDVLATECPNWANDYPCQDKFWDSYAQRRYGSWVEAQAFWLEQLNKTGSGWW